MRGDAIMRGLGRHWLASVLCLGVVCGILAGDDREAGRKEKAVATGATESKALTAEESRAVSLDALQELGDLVGEWRGVGRPKRNSTAGAWLEKGEWVWEIKKERVGLRYNVKDGKQIVTALLTFDPAKREYQLDATLDDKSTRRYTGTFADNRLTLVSLPKAEGTPTDGRIHQLDIKQLSDKRTVVLYQSRLKEQQQFALVAEVGYTREGTKLAEEGVDGPQCIVTGGKGTSSTVYKGKTYWFCCTGCRDAFNEDPDGVIAEAAKRAAKKKDGAQPRKGAVSTSPLERDRHRKFSTRPACNDHLPLGLRNFLPAGPPLVGVVVLFRSYAPETVPLDTEPGGG
jgi:YHS domain-containing protein